MSSHTERINSHSIHENLKHVLSELEKASKIADNPPVAVETLARIDAIVNNFSSSLENCHPDFVAIKWLDQSSNALSNIRSYLNNYSSNKDANSLINNSSGQLDILLQCSSQLNCVKSSKGLKGIMAAQSTYLRRIDEQTSLYFDKIKDLEHQVNSFKSHIQEQDNKAKDKLIELQNTINSEKQRLDQFAVSYQNQMLADQKEFSSTNDSFKKEFLSYQTAREKTFNDLLQNIKDTAMQVQESALIQQNDFKSNGISLIDEYREKFEELKKQAENIVGIVSSNTFSFKYKEVADDAHKRARFWHGAAVILMLLVGIFAVYAFIVTVNEDTSWVKLIAKIFATSTLVSGAAYSARQASKHEKVERYARKIEMELVSIDPFIASLEEDERSSIKLEISRKIFGNPDGMEISSKDEPYTAMEKLAKNEDLLIQVLTKLAK